MENGCNERAGFLVALERHRAALLSTPLVMDRVALPFVERLAERHRNRCTVCTSKDVERSLEPCKNTFSVHLRSINLNDGFGTTSHSRHPESPAPMPLSLWPSGPSSSISLTRASASEAS